MMSLAHYAKEVEDICALIDSETGDLTPLMARFEQASADMSTKVDNWVGYLRALKQRIDHLKAIQDEYKKAAKAAENTDKRLREYLKFQMESHPDIPFRGSEGSLRLQANSAAALTTTFDLPEKTVYKVIDQSLLSLEPSLNKYARAITFYVLDTEVLKRDAEAGKAPHWAKLERGKHVRIGV